MCGMLWQRLVRDRPTPLPTDTPSSASQSMMMHQRIFGYGARKGEPTDKLNEAASVMRTRIEELEARGSSLRMEAIALQKAGQKAAALRALKKAKIVERQAEANQASLTAVEQQVDMLAQAALHKTMTTALASTSAAVKRDAKALSRAESVMDDVAEARDMASELNQVMADFAASSYDEVDDNDLAAELEQMLGEATLAPSKEHEVAELERRIAAKQATMQAESDALADRMPVAPTGSARKQEEQAGLLSSSGG